MNIFSSLLTITGLSLFEIISSIDNAVINAEVLNTMQPKARNWFLFWGLLFAVVIVRGLLPWLIVWLTLPGQTPLQALTATFSNDPKVIEAIEFSSPILLVGGGVFLVFLFFHWLFLEKKHFGLIGERFFYRQGGWVYAVVSILLSVLVWFSIHESGMVAFGMV